VQIDRNDDEPITLTEGNISEAKLTGPTDAHKMAQLRWWLLYCGIKTPNSSNKKKQVDLLCYALLKFETSFHYRIQEVVVEGLSVVDVDSSYLYRKQQTFLSRQGCCFGSITPSRSSSCWLGIVMLTV